MLEGERLEVRHERTPLETVVPLKAPYVLFIDPCGACNFSCNFCPCNISNYRREERHAVMPLELFREIIDDVSTFPEQVKVIYLFGFGEPLLHKDFFDMAKYAREKNACRELRVVTNGSLLSPEVNQQIVDSGIDLVRISVEALDAKGYQDVCSYQIDYDHFLDNIRDLHERGKGKTKVAAKIVNATLKSDEDVKRFFSIFEPITDFTFVEDIVAGWPEFDECVIPDDSTIESNNWIWKRENYQRCSFPLTMMMVHSCGVVSPCPNDWKMSIPLGDVHKDKLTKIWNSEKLKQFRLLQLETDRSNIPVCKNCVCCAYDNIDPIADVLAKRIRENA